MAQNTEQATTPAIDVESSTAATTETKSEPYSGDLGAV